MSSLDASVGRSVIEVILVILHCAVVGQDIGVAGHSLHS